MDIIVHLCVNSSTPPAEQEYELQLKASIPKNNILDNNTMHRRKGQLRLHKNDKYTSYYTSQLVSLSGINSPPPNDLYYIQINKHHGRQDYWLCMYRKTCFYTIALVSYSFVRLQTLSLYLNF